MRLEHWLLLYCSLVLFASMFGGSLPFLGKVTHGRLQFYLSLSAGVMLGAAFFHIMPDAMELAGPYFGWWMSLGVVGLFCIERFIAPHSHELDGGKHPHHEHHHDHGEELAHGHAHAHEHHRAAAPTIGGWMAVLGLTIHTFMNGLGLAGSVQTEMAKGDATAWASFAPGFAMFLAIALHKPADALAISTVLSRKGVGRRLIALVQFGFAVMVPVGAVVFLLVSEAISKEQQGILNQFTGAALAFSSGTFLFIALSDLLPEVQFHSHDRVQLFFALVFGVALMGGIALLEDHDHGHDHGQEPSGAVEGGEHQHPHDHGEDGHHHH